MAPLTPAQAVWRARVETGIRLAAPLLDLLLLAGDRVSRIAGAADRRELTEPRSRPPLPR